MAFRSAFILTLVLTALAWGLYIYFENKTITGQVVDEVSGQPVAGATVVLGDESQATDAEGRFSFQGLSGQLPLLSSGAGYITVQGQVSLEDFLVKTFAIQVVLRPTELRLHVRDAWTQEAVEGAGVLVNGGEVIEEGNGGFILRRIEEGETILVSGEDYEPQEIVYDGRLIWELLLEPQVVTVTVKDLYTGQPLADAQVSWGPDSAATDSLGVVEIRRDELSTTLGVQHADYATSEAAYDGQETLEVLLRPNTLSGVITAKNSGAPLAGVEVLLEGEVVATTTADGTYVLVDLPAEGPLVFLRPGYQGLTVELPLATTLDISLVPLVGNHPSPTPLPTAGNPFVAQGIYINFGLLTQPDRVLALLDTVDRTELNAIVVDIKGDSGRLAYPSQIPLAQEIGASASGLMDVQELLRLAKERGIYTIARLVVFKDPVLGSRRPDLAVHRSDGSLWADHIGAFWVDPFNPVVREYNWAVAREVARLGFDEIQFDYVRFPSDGTVRDTVYSQPSTSDSRREAVRTFLAQAHEDLRVLDKALSADIFAITAWVQDDQGIGQTVEETAPYVDYFSPMVYPSTFSPGVGGFPVPTQYPYDIVYQTIILVRGRTSTPVRPWLQHFGDYAYSVPYGLNEFLAQKRAAQDAGAIGWLFWNALGIYNEQTFSSP